MLHVSATDIAARLRASGSVFAEDEAKLLIAAAQTPTELEQMVEQRVAGLPIEQIVGWAEFCGRRVSVEPGVFVPRRRSEFLAAQATKVTKPGDIVLDLGCGAGALGLTVAASVSSVQLLATDIDPVASSCARYNIGDRGQVFCGDLFSALPPSLHGQINVIIANMPYVPTAAIDYLPAEARLHEPQFTLDGGGDGLELHRRVAAEACTWLAPGGHLLIEVTAQQAPAAQQLFARHHLQPKVTEDTQREATIIIGAKLLKLLIYTV